MCKVLDNGTSLDHSGRGKILTKYLSKDLDQATYLGIDLSKARFIINTQLKI